MVVRSCGMESRKKYMKVIHVTYEAERYGIGTFLIDLLEYQKKNYENLEVAVVFHADGPRIEKYRELGVPVYSLGRKTAKDIRLLFPFYKIFKDYDIINLHSPSPWAFLAAVLAGKKIVYTFHGSLCLRTLVKIPLTVLYLKCVFLKRCDFVTFASKASFKHFKEGYNNIIIDKDKYDIFSYGINIDNVKPQTDKDTVRRNIGLENKFVVGTAVRMVPFKRPDLLINAFSKLSPIEEYSLVLMGSGSNEYESYLRNLAKESKLDKCIYFLGYRSDAIDIINALDVFVLPSRREPFGLALLEAMLLGLPCVVFKDGGGTIDIIGDSGIVVNSVDELSDTIKLLNNDFELRKKKGKMGRNRAKKFEISKTASHLMSIYRSILYSK